MLIEHSSDIIKKWQADKLYNGEYVELCIFKDDKALVISHDTLSLIKHEKFLHDELGNGLLAQESFCESFDTSNTPWVTTIKAGFIGFSDQKAVLIMPNSIKLFASNHDALHNKNPLCQLLIEQP